MTNSTKKAYKPQGGRTERAVHLQRFSALKANIYAYQTAFFLKNSKLSSKNLLKMFDIYNSMSYNISTKIKKSKKRRKIFMKRIIDVDMEIKAKKFKTALKRFFKKYPELNYWEGVFEGMYENGEDHFIDNIDNMGNKIDWSYSLWLDVNEESFCFAIIERA